MRLTIVSAAFLSAWVSLVVVQGAQAQAQDAKPPSCAQTAVGTDASGRKFVQITVQDVGSGLGSLVVTTSSNAVTVVPPFAVGTTDPVVVTATKIDQSQTFTVALQATDVAGNITPCEFDDIPVVGGGGSGGGGGNPGATPELDSLLLFGSGLSGLGGYALMRLRARRRAKPI